MERIIRALGDVKVNESRHVEGYALLFNVRSRYIGWYETISPNAISQETIKNSDIFALFNHDRGKVLARSEYGKGTLKLEIDEKGLKYSFDTPKTALGDELLEYLSRGDIHQSSFAFSIDFNNDDMVKKEFRNGEVYYTIKNIPVLHDVSPVWTPAYIETYVGKRAAEIAQRMLDENTTSNITLENRMNNEEQKEKDEELKDNETSSEENKEAENKAENKEENKEENAEAENKEENKEAENKEENEEENKEEAEDKDEENKTSSNEKRSEKNINKNNHSTMKEQKFSLIKAIRAIANNQELDAATRTVINQGAQEMRNSGLSFGGQIQIPVGEQFRDGISVTGVHDDLIVTDFTNILEPLRANNVCAQAGCKYLQGLVGDIQVPVMGAEQVGWAGEIADAADGSGNWDHITLTPHRITAYIDVSKQFLAQDALGAEQLIRQDLVNALNSKLEETILSADAATATKPAGIFYGKTVKDIATFADITDLESDVEAANINGTMKYVVSPKAKAALRNMARSADSTRLVMEGDEVDGTPALVTTNMATNTLGFGSWENVAIGQWGAIDLVVDPYTVARSGQVRIVLNAYFDFKLLRDDAIVYGTTDVD